MAVYKHFIGGEWVESHSGETFSSTNPSTLESLGDFQKGTSEDLQAAIDAAETAQRKWAEIPVPKRARVLYKATQILTEMKEELSRLETAEMGKVLLEARADVQEAIDYAEYFAGEGRRYFGNTTPSELENKWALTMRQPVGVVGCITPWNFPIAIPALKLFPAILCGNGVVFKPSSDTPLCALKLVEVIEKAGVPKGVLNLVTGPADPVGQGLVTSPKTDGISFTGHRDTGKWILENAGIKKVGLELGSKNAIIVMDDADMKLALDGSIWGAYATSGQRCSAASRIIVHEDVRKKFEQEFSKRAQMLKVGYGLEEDVDMGPLVNKRQLEKVDSYTTLAKKEGAKVLIGGEKLKHKRWKGFFYKPTIFTEVSSKMEVAREEIFGPSVSIISADDFDHAIDTLNSVEYGLTAAIYTKNITRALKAVDRIQSGTVYVNAPTIGGETHLPWGGVKKSGIGGREGGIVGINEFSELKVVYIDFSDRLQRAQIESVKQKNSGKV